MDAPSSIVVINAKEIRARGYRSIKQILNDVPGFNDTSDVNEELGAVRGVTATTTNHIMTMVNGHRMNDLMLGRYNLDQYLGIDTIERIEFIRGPASALYGTGALVAAINIITKKGADVDGSQVRATAGLYANELSTTWGKKVGGYDVFFNFTFLDANGQTQRQSKEFDLKGPMNAFFPMGGRPATEGDVYTGRYRQNMSGLVTVRSDNSTLMLRAAHFRRATPRGSNGSFYDYDNEAFKPTYTENDFLADYKYEWRIMDRFKLTLNPSVHFFSYYEQSFITFGSNDVPPLGSRSGMLGEFTDYQFKAHAEYQALPELNIIGGVDALVQDVQRADAWSINGGGTLVPQVLNGTAPAVTVFPNFYAKPGKWIVSGAFLQGIWTPLKPLAITLGGRLDSFDGRADSRVTPRVGIVYKPIEKLAVKLLYGQSYLAPMWAHTQANDGNFYGNPNLKPETFENTDLIVAYQDKQFNVSADFYYNYFTGLINAVRFDPIKTPNVQQYRNSGDAVYYGGDLTGDARVLPWLRLTGGYSLIVPDTKVAETQCPPMAPVGCYDTQPDPRGTLDASGNPAQLNIPKRDGRGTSPALLVYDYGKNESKIKDIPTHTLRYGVRVDPIPNLTISVWGRAYSKVWTTDSVQTQANWVTADQIANAKKAMGLQPTDSLPAGINVLPRVTIKPVFLLDASVMYNLGWGTVQLVGTNLMDQFYEIGGSGMPRPLARMGLNVEGSLSVKW